MRDIKHMVNGVVPEPVKAGMRRLLYRFRNKHFEPYLKKKNVEGVSFDFWIGDTDGRQWYDVGCTDPVWIEMRFLKEHLIEPGDVVLECGAHHGCTTILLSNWVGSKGKIVAFEALPQNCEIIKKNLEQNDIGNVVLERKAVGLEKGRINICEQSNASVAPSGRGIDVELTHLDEYENLNPTVLKLDVEGFELQVLQGARKILSRRPKLAIEIHAEELSKYGAKVEDIFSLIGVDDYGLWVQWDDSKAPEPYDLKAPITKRVHLFAIPNPKPASPLPR